MTPANLDWKAEVAKVQSELTFFRRECLPAFLGGSAQVFLSEDMSDHLRDHIVTVAGHLSDWQTAASRLAEYLPLGPLPVQSPQPAHADFHAFLFQKATSGHAVSAGRLHWRIALFHDLDTDLAWCPVYDDLSADAKRDRATLLSRLPEVKRWLIGLAVTDCILWNALCSVLPAIADADPVFAKWVLDIETWQQLVRAKANLNQEERAEQLDFLDRYWFRYIINNALLHVLGAMANEHFLLIQDYLDHPCLRGSYTHLMPHALFAVLFEKVIILCRLVQEIRVT